MHIYAPRRLSCTHTHSGSNIFRDDHATPHRQSHRRAGAESDPSVGVVGVHIRQAKSQRHLRQMNQPSRCERSVKEMFTFIHPSPAAATLHPSVYQHDDWHIHPHTLVFALGRHALISETLTQSPMHALCVAVRSTWSHTYIFSPRTIMEGAELATSCWHFHRH